MHPRSSATIEAADPSSFRDPAGRVHEIDGRILRTVNDRALDDYLFVRQSGVLARLVESGRLIAATEVDARSLGQDSAARLVVEHPRVPFISYPYEWSFPALQAAALLHLDLQLELLQHGIALSDASAYNVQFLGPRPIFIDVLSLRRYRPGEYWTGHRQFCEQFLNPLLLGALVGIAHNAWYRGNIEGIATADLARVLPWRRRLSWRVLAHVVLQDRLQRRAARAGGAIVRRGHLSTQAYRGFLLQLRSWIAALRPADTGATVWADYADRTSYAAAEEAAKRGFVAEFCAAVKPRQLWDLGCNTGAYAELALRSGAGSVIGFDADHGALRKAFARANAHDLDFLPLYLDAANPSPDQGWGQAERRGLDRRASADAVLALAFEHHLAIGRNLPLDRVVRWLVGLAPRGVVEFVPKSDPTVQRMLALREDIFDRYGESEFRDVLSRHARVHREAAVSATGRQLFWYERG